MVKNDKWVLNLLYKLAFIKASKHRTNIVKSLAESNKTPKQLSIELDINKTKYLPY